MTQIHSFIRLIDIREQVPDTILRKHPTLQIGRQEPSLIGSIVPLPHLAAALAARSIRSSICLILSVCSILSANLNPNRFSKAKIKINENITK